MTAGPGRDLETAGEDGTRLVGRVWSAPARPKSLVVVVHGLKDHGGRYDALAEGLNAAGVTVVAFDLRGHGRSAGDRAWVTRFAQFDSDLAAELRAARETCPGVPLVLLGHSMGGAIAARFALDHPDLLRGLVLSAPALRPPLTAPPGAAGIVRLLSVVAPHARVFRPDIPGFSRVPAVLAAMGVDPLIDPRPVPARTAAELLRTMVTVRDDAPRLQMPLLVFAGTADRVTDPAGGREFVERSHSTRRQFRSVPDAFHDLWHEPEAPSLERELADWVGETTA
jgi:acylglycerol lipase